MGGETSEKAARISQSSGNIERHSDMGTDKPNLEAGEILHSI